MEKTIRFGVTCVLGAGHPVLDGRTEYEEVDVDLEVIRQLNRQGGAVNRQRAYYLTEALAESKGIFKNCKEYRGSVNARY